MCSHLILLTLKLYHNRIKKAISKLAVNVAATALSLHKLQNDAQDNKRLYEQYIRAIRALNESMDRYYTPGEDGLPPTVEQEDKERLLAVIEAAARCGEGFLADLTAKGRGLNAGVPNMVTQLQKMLSQDYETMKYYDPANDEMTLPELKFTLLWNPAVTLESSRPAVRQLSKPELKR